MSRHKMFRNVRLGPHESTLRTMILADDPGNFDRYHWMGRVLVLDGTVLDGFIMEPTVQRYGRRHLYVFTYGGCAWSFVVSRDAVHEWLPLALQPDGAQVLLRQQVTKDESICDFLVDFLRTQSAS